MCLLERFAIGKLISRLLKTDVSRNCGTAESQSVRKRSHNYTRITLRFPVNRLKAFKRRFNWRLVWLWAKHETKLSVWNQTSKSLNPTKTTKLYLQSWVDLCVCVCVFVCVCTCAGCGLHPQFVLMMFSFQISDLQSTSWLCEEKRNAVTHQATHQGERHKHIQKNKTHVRWVSTPKLSLKTTLTVII